MKKKAALYTLGCRVNQYETEAMAEILKKEGYDIVDFDEVADVYIINTCTVTSIGDKKSRQVIRKAKKLNPQSIVLVTGCYAQVSSEEISKIDGVDIILGTANKSQLVGLIDDFKINHQQLVKVENIMSIRDFEEMEIDEYQNKTRAFLKIQDGCDRFCSYCMIPYARGPVRSKNPETVFKEVKKLSDNGFKEILLSGIHVSSYGKDLKDITLIDLIEKINNDTSIERIRIGSIDPDFFTDETIEKLSKLNKLCPHFHISLQSGANETLKRMNRHYTAETYCSVVEKLRNSIANVSITTDIIVGFPGETNEEFNETLGFLEKIKLSKMHIFKYSIREGTKAATFKDQIPPKIKDERSKLLDALDKANEKAFISSYLDKEFKVLFEESYNGYAYGFTENYIKVKVPSDKELVDTIQNVKLSAIEEDIALGLIE